MHQYVFVLQDAPTRPRRELFSHRPSIALPSFEEVAGAVLDFSAEQASVGPHTVLIELARRSRAPLKARWLAWVGGESLGSTDSHPAAGQVHTVRRGRQLVRLWQSSPGF